MTFQTYCEGPPPLKEGCNSFFITNTASFITTVSASISVVSSLTILYIVFRSTVGFGSVYHRIMTSIAIFDFISSLALSLTTIPIPTDVIYQYQGNRVYGTVATCDAQAFAIMFGCVGSFFMTLGLCVFYVAIICRIKDTKLRKYLEPSIHIIAYALAAGFSVSRVLVVTVPANCCSVSHLILSYFISHASGRFFLLFLLLYIDFILILKAI